MRRWLLGLIILAVLVAALFWVVPYVVWRVEAPIRVGILHSKTGPLAISEQSMIDAELLAIEEINAGGGPAGPAGRGGGRRRPVRPAGRSPRRRGG